MTVPIWTDYPQIQSARGTECRDADTQSPYLTHVAASVPLERGVKGPAWGPGRTWRGFNGTSCQWYRYDAMVPIQSNGIHTYNITRPFTDTSPSQCRGTDERAYGIVGGSPSSWSSGWSSDTSHWHQGQKMRGQWRVSLQRNLQNLYLFNDDIHIVMSWNMSYDWLIQWLLNQSIMSWVINYDSWVMTHDRWVCHRWVGLKSHENHITMITNKITQQQRLTLNDLGIEKQHKRLFFEYF